MAAAPSPGESSRTLIAMLATQASMPPAAARAMQSTARFENLRSIGILLRAKTLAGEFGSWKIFHLAPPSSPPRFCPANLYRPTPPATDLSPTPSPHTHDDSP